MKYSSCTIVHVCLTKLWPKCRNMGAARIFFRGEQKNFAYKITFKILRIFSRIVLVLWVPILKPRWRHRVCWKSLYQALINYDDGILADYLLADHLLDSRSSARRDKLSRWSFESRKSFAHEELAIGYWCLGNKFWLLVYKQTAIGAKYCFTLKWSKSILYYIRINSSWTGRFENEPKSSYVRITLWFDFEYRSLQSFCFAQLSLLVIENAMENAIQEFSSIFELSELDADELDVELTCPRLAKRQKHRTNTPADTPEDYFQRTVFVPFANSSVWKSFFGKKFGCLSFVCLASEKLQNSINNWVLENCKKHTKHVRKST